MALLTRESFDPLTKTRNSIHKKASATYTVFDDESDYIFQIDTYGTMTREFVDRCSLSVTGVRKNIDKLRKLNQFKRIGPDKGGHWEIDG